MSGQVLKGLSVELVDLEMVKLSLFCLLFVQIFGSFVGHLLDKSTQQQRNNQLLLGLVLRSDSDLHRLFALLSHAGEF